MQSQQLVSLRATKTGKGRREGLGDRQWLGTQRHPGVDITKEPFRACASLVVVVSLSTGQPFGVKDERVTKQLPGWEGQGRGAAGGGWSGRGASPHRDSTLT